MWEVLSGLHGEDFVAAVAVGGGLTLALAVAAMKVWLANRSREMAVTIVQDMLDQGMSAEQIERVLRAAGFDRAGTRLEGLKEDVRAARKEIHRAVS